MTRRGIHLGSTPAPDFTPPLPHFPPPSRMFPELQGMHCLIRPTTVPALALTQRAMATGPSIICNHSRGPSPSASSAAGLGGFLGEVTQLLIPVLPDLLVPVSFSGCGCCPYPFSTKTGQKKEEAVTTQMSSYSPLCGWVVSVA